MEWKKLNILTLEDFLSFLCLVNSTHSLLLLVYVDTDWRTSSDLTHTFSHSFVHTHPHRHAPCVWEPKGWLCPQGWKDYYGLESERGRDEPLNLWEWELLPNKYSQSNKPDSFCLKLNELRFYGSSLMGSNRAFFAVSISHYCILCMHTK